MLDFQVAKETSLEEILDDPELWRWDPNRYASEKDSGGGGCLVELSKQVDKGCVREELKPIEK